jgi:hypothetical protein
MTRAIQVTVLDLDTNETETKQIDSGDFLLITTEPCYLAGTQRFPQKGTTILTVKDHHPTSKNTALAPQSVKENETHGV